MFQATRLPQFGQNIAVVGIVNPQDEHCLVAAAAGCWTVGAGCAGGS